MRFGCVILTIAILFLLNHHCTAEENRPFCDRSPTALTVFSMAVNLYKTFLSANDSLVMGRPILKPQGVLCQTLPLNYTRPSFARVEYVAGHLMSSETGNVVGRWDARQQCFVPIHRPSSTPQSLPVQRNRRVCMQAKIATKRGKIRSNTTKMPQALNLGHILLPLQNIREAILIIASSIKSASYIVSTIETLQASTAQTAIEVFDLENSILLRWEEWDRQWMNRMPNLHFLAESVTTSFNRDVDVRVTRLLDTLGDCVLNETTEKIHTAQQHTKESLQDLLEITTLGDSTVTDEVMVQFDEQGVLVVENALDISNSLVSLLKTCDLSFQQRQEITEITTATYSLSVFEMVLRALTFNTWACLSEKMNSCIISSHDNTTDRFWSLVERKVNPKRRMMKRDDEICFSSPWSPDARLHSFLRVMEHMESLLSVVLNVHAVLIEMSTSSSSQHLDCLVKKMEEFQRLNGSLVLVNGDLDWNQENAPTEVASCRRFVSLPEWETLWLGFEDVRMATESHSLAMGTTYSTNGIAFFFPGNEDPRSFETVCGQSKQDNRVFNVSSLPRETLSLSLPTRTVPDWRATTSINQTHHAKAVPEPCPPGTFGTDCTICPSGTFCPGDGFQRFCSNAPPESQYIGEGGRTEDCPFVCLREEMYRKGNFCIPTPAGKFSPDGGYDLEDCVPALGPPFSTFSSGGRRTSDSCTEAFNFPLVALLPVEDTFARVLGINATELTLELWGRMDENCAVRDVDVGYVLAKVVDGWRWSLVYSPSNENETESSFRMIFESLTENGARTTSRPFALMCEQWYHFAVSADHHRRDMTFYVNAQEVGHDWFHADFLSVNRLSEIIIAIGGDSHRVSNPAYPPALFEWFCGKVDEFRVWAQRLPPEELGYRQSEHALVASCIGCAGEFVNEICHRPCPFGMSRQAEEGCSCDSGNEQYILDQCSSHCESGMRGEGGICKCSYDYYHAWGFPGARYLTIAANDSSSYPFRLTEVVVTRPNGKTIHPISCTEKGGHSSSCSRLFDSLKDPEALAWSAAVTRGGRVTLDLGPENWMTIDRIDVYAYGSVDSDSIQLSIFLGSTPVPSDSDEVTGEAIAHGIPLTPMTTMGGTTPALVLDDRVVTWAESPALTCVPCTENVTIASYPQTTLKDCQCMQGYVWLGYQCVIAQEPLSTPIFSLPAGTYPSGTELIISVDTTESAPVSIRLSLVPGAGSASESTSFSQKTIPGRSGIVKLYGDYTIMAVAHKEGCLPSESITARFKTFPKVETPIILPNPSVPFSDAAYLYLYTVTPNATVHYTVDGSDVTLESPEFLLSHGLVVRSRTILTVRAFLEGFLDSDQVQVTFEKKETPLATPASDASFPSRVADTIMDKVQSCRDDPTPCILAASAPALIVGIVVSIFWRRWRRKRRAAKKERKKRKFDYLAKKKVRTHKKRIQKELHHGKNVTKARRAERILALKKNRGSLKYITKDKDEGSTLESVTQTARLLGLPVPSLHTDGEECSPHHKRVPICDWCTQKPAAIHCRECSDRDAEFLCAECDRLAHQGTTSSTHFKTHMMSCRVCERLSVRLMHCDTCNTSLCPRCFEKRKPHKKHTIKILRRCSLCQEEEATFHCATCHTNMCVECDVECHIAPGFHGHKRSVVMPKRWGELNR